MKSLTKIKEITKLVILPLSLIGGLIGGAFLINSAWNNKSIKNDSYSLISYATGIAGHVEYVKYSDSSQEVKTYPNLGHRLFISEFNQDINGDGLVDRIRQNRSELGANSLKKLLVRANHYPTNQEAFDKADKQLQELMIKYPSKK